MKIKGMRSSLFILSVVLGLCFGEAQADTLERIGMAIQSGNSKELAKYFDNSVEITIYQGEEVYSKAQAELVIRDFFNKHSPSSFKTIHKGNSNQGSQYGIGSLITKNGTFRTYIYIKQKGSSFFIQEIRFEND